MLKRARSASLIKENVATLNSQTVAARVLKGEVLLNCVVIRVNRLCKEINFV